MATAFLIRVSGLNKIQAGGAYQKEFESHSSLPICLKMNDCRWDPITTAQKPFVLFCGDTILHQDCMDPVFPRTACGSWDFKSVRKLSSTNGVFLSSPAAPMIRGAVGDQRQLW